jgi:two-component system copper resistance phosphate regulon response regulator CusR
MALKLLVIEDQDDFADFVVRGLREEGLTAERAADMTSAWHAMTSGDWDVILLDRGLPGGDGLSLLRRYRDEGHMTPVLVLTARDAVPDRVAGLDSGADDYLPKPFSFDELLARIRALSRRPAMAGSPILSHADVRVDLATQRVERNGQRIDLTAKEYALLVYFMRHPGQVLTRTRIYEHVWDERYDGLSNTLEVHVKELRRKLEAQGTRLIQTLRNRGYRFSVDEDDAT